MNFAMAHNIDAYIGVVDATDDTTAVAAGSGDATLVVGLPIDRFATGWPLSASFVIRYKAVLGAGATLSIGSSVETATDAAFTAPVVLQTTASAVVDTGAAGGSTQRGVFRVPVDLAGALEFVRIKFTPDLSAANTDTGEFAAIAILGGQDYLPA
jgi:hypothetical protein